MLLVHDGPRIIVADDDSAIRKLLDVLLSKEGYRVVLCASVDEAFAAVDAGGAELLISDLEMPGRSGLDLIRGLRAERNLIPVLLMSGLENHPSIPAALGYSGVQFLAKPFTIGECRKVVAGMVRWRASRRP